MKDCLLSNVVIWELGPCIGMSSLSRWKYIAHCLSPYKPYKSALYSKYLTISQ